MKKLMLLAAMMAMGLLVAVPAMAQVGQENEQDGESGEVDQSFTVTGSGSNGNSCTPLQGTGQSGNSQNQIGVTQSDESEADDFEFEEAGSNITSSGSNSTECVQEVNQAASAAAAPKAPPPPPAPKAAPPAPKAPPPPLVKAETPGAVAQAPAPPPPPPPPPPKMEAKKAEAKKAEEKKELPKTGGSGTVSLFALGAGALLVAGGLLARRITR